MTAPDYARCTMARHTLQPADPCPLCCTIAAGVQCRAGGAQVVLRESPCMHYMSSPDTCLAADTCQSPLLHKHTTSPTRPAGGQSGRTLKAYLSLLVDQQLFMYKDAKSCLVWTRWAGPLERPLRPPSMDPCRLHVLCLRGMFVQSYTKQRNVAVVDCMSHIPCSRQF